MQQIPRKNERKIVYLSVNNIINKLQPNLHSRDTCLGPKGVP